MTIIYLSMAIAPFETSLSTRVDPRMGLPFAGYSVVAGSLKSRNVVIDVLPDIAWDDRLVR